MYNVVLSVPLSTGIFDWFNEKNASALSAARALSVTVAVVFVIVVAVVSRLAAARIIVAILMAALFVWGVFNVTKLKDRVDTEMSSGSLVRAAVSADRSTT